MRLYFIRHGQSANNAMWDAQQSDANRSEDPELTEIGHEQARLLADFVRDTDARAKANGKHGSHSRDYFGITHLYTSLMVRSVATGSYLSRALEIPLVGWPEIHECGGIYLDSEDQQERIGLPGKGRSYFATHYSHLRLPETITDEGWWNRPFEAREDRPLRANQVIQTLLERHGDTDDVVAMVSHGAFYMELSRVLFGIGAGKSWFVMNNTGISRLDFRANGERVLFYHNRTDHLPERLVT